MLALLVAAAACGGGQKRGVATAKDFECNDRHAEYMQSGGIMYAEQGVRMKCDGNAPVVEEYFTRDDGTETKRSARIGAAAWEAAWDDIDNAGWRLLEDCDNPTVSEKDPIYTFEVGDDRKTVTFRCQGNPLPFPFDTLVVGLDKAKGELPVVEGAE